MASFSNPNKSSTTITNVVKDATKKIWDSADFTWNDGGGLTWDTADRPAYEKPTKNTTSISNDTKN